MSSPNCPAQNEQPKMDTPKWTAQKGQPKLASPKWTAQNGQPKMASPKWPASQYLSSEANEFDAKIKKYYLYTNPKKLSTTTNFDVFLHVIIVCHDEIPRETSNHNKPWINFIYSDSLSKKKIPETYLKKKLKKSFL